MDNNDLTNYHNIQPSNGNIAPSPTATPKPQSNPTNKHKRIIPFIIVGGGLLLIIAAIVILILTGFLYVGVKGQNQKIIIETPVCGEQEVATFNDLQSRMNLGMKDAVSGDFENLVNKIKENPDYTKDPTCDYVVFMFNYNFTNDSVEMKRAFENLKSVNQHGLFVDNSIKYMLDTWTMEFIINPLEADKNESNQL